MPSVCLPHDAEPLLDTIGERPPRTEHCPLETRRNPANGQSCAVNHILNHPLGLAHVGKDFIRLQSYYGITEGTAGYERGRFGVTEAITTSNLPTRGVLYL
jgi:hypothetical protein